MIFKFADIGEGIHEGKVAEIFKNVGDDVKEGDNLLSVETDKMTAEIPSPYTGKITKLFVKPGQVIHVGADLYEFATSGGAQAVAPKAEAHKAPEKPQEEAASVVGSIKVSNDELQKSIFGAGTNFVKTTESALSQAIKMSGGSVSRSSSTQASNNYVTPRIEKANIPAKVDGAEFDVVVIGSGPGGYKCGELLAHHGFKTAVIEKDKVPGGVCLNVGCIPTKALLKSSKVYSLMKHSHDYGIEVDMKDVKFSWEKILERKRGVVKKLNSGIEFLLKANKVPLIYGEATIVDKHTVKVGDRLIKTSYIVLATGSVPVIFPMPGFQEAYKNGWLIDSTGALELKQFPKELVIMGAGVIGIEFAIVYASFGAKVTILQGVDRPVEKLDSDISAEAVKILKSAGVNLVLNAKINGCDHNKKVVHVEINGKAEEVHADAFLVSVGRAAVSNLAKDLGVECSPKGMINVNKFQQTNIPNVFAIGDCSTQMMLAHVAYKHAQVVVGALSGHPQFINYSQIPSAVYSFPEMAMVGKTEEELKAEKVEYLKAKLPMKVLGKALADGDENLGFLKLLVGKEFGEILGCHVVSSTASDMISEITAVMEAEATVHDIALTVHGHPTINEITWEAALEIQHQMMKKK